MLLELNTASTFENTHEEMCDSGFWQKSRTSKPSLIAKLPEPNLELKSSRTHLCVIKCACENKDYVRVTFSCAGWSLQRLEKLADVFGPTSSEMHVLSGYLNHLPQKDIAPQRDRSLDTIKAQSKTILCITNCAKKSRCRATLKQHGDAFEPRAICVKFSSK